MFWMHTLLISRVVCFVPSLLESGRMFIFTWDAQVDSRTRRILSCHLVHHLCMVTSCVCCGGCQDDQLIVRSDFSAGHKSQGEQGIRKHSNNQLKGEHASVQRCSVSDKNTAQTKTQTRGEYLVHGSFRIHKGGKETLNTSIRKERGFRELK